MECSGVPGLRADWSIQTKKSRVLVRFSEVLLRGSQEGNPGRCGRRVLGSHSRNLYLFVTVQAVIEGMC